VFSCLDSKRNTSLSPNYCNLYYNERALNVNEPQSRIARSVREEEIMMDDEIIRDMIVIATVGSIAVLIYFMFGTRRTILRIFGWIAAPFIVGFILINIHTHVHTNHEPNPTAARAETTKIINDMRNLRGAALEFHKEFEAWPLLGQDASLDAFCNPPILLREPLRYARVMLACKQGDTDGLNEFYIGVELIPQKNGAAIIQRYLAMHATDVGLLQQPTANGSYESGLNVYMRIN
jgi:hypothetical protein